MPQPIAARDRELVAKAFELASKRRTKRTTVATVLRTVSGELFQGVNIEVRRSAPCSMCAEYAAVGAMVTSGGTKIDTIVTVNGKKDLVLPPCGKCRQFISEFGNPFVILKVRGKFVKRKIADLYPLPVR